MAVNTLPTQEVIMILGFSLTLKLKVHNKTHNTNQWCEAPSLQLGARLLVNNNRGGNMIMQRNSEYLLKEVDDATIRSFILWN